MKQHTVAEIRAIMGRNLPTSDHAKRIAIMFHRKLTTPWGKKEQQVFRSLRPFDEEDLKLVERYYRWNWPPSAGKNILRHDLATFLNNYPGEVDRARIWSDKHPLNPVAKPPRLPKQELPDPPAEVDPVAQEKFRQEFEKRSGRKLYRPPSLYVVRNEAA